MNSPKLSYASVFFCFILLAAATWAEQLPSHPQTPRQALMEMMSGSQKALMKHLTVEVQQALSKAGIANQGFLGMEFVTHAGGKLEVFETGSLLCSVTEAGTHKKLEINIDSESLNGDEDSVELSFHSFRDGMEEKEGWGLLAPQFRIELKRQEKIWRLTEIAFGARFPVGNPDFVTGLFGQPTGLAQNGNTENKEGKLYSYSVKPGPPEDMQPETVVSLLGMEEALYARTHMDTGFTCSLRDLMEERLHPAFDAVLGDTGYHGYRFTLAGCLGKPAGGFQLIAEPIVPGSGKAFCLDATQNLRSSDDGRGATCIAAGKFSTSFGAVIRSVEHAPTP